MENKNSNSSDLWMSIGTTRQQIYNSKEYENFSVYWKILCVDRSVLYVHHFSSSAAPV